MSVNALKIWVRADGGSNVGYGHLKRTLTLLRRLAAKREISVSYIMTADSDSKPVIDAGWNLIFTGSRDGINWIKQIPSTSDLLILDSYNINEDDLKKLRSLPFQLVMFDDGCRLKSYPVDLLIDSAPRAASLNYNGSRDTIFCLGLDYYPLREEFQDFNHRIQQSQTCRKITVTFGGSDPDDATAKYLKAVTSISDFDNIDVILGPGYQGTATELTDDKRVNFLKNPSKLASVLGNSDLALSASGGTAIELAYLGVPSVLITLSPDQEPIAGSLHRAMAADHLGDLSDVQISDVNSKLKFICRNPGLRQAMSENGRKLIDGLGAGRIADKVLELIDNRQRKRRG